MSRKHKDKSAWTLSLAIFSRTKIKPISNQRLKSCSREVPISDRNSRVVNAFTTDGTDMVETELPARPVPLL